MSAGLQREGDGMEMVQLVTREDDIHSGGKNWQKSQKRHKPKAGQTDGVDVRIGIHP